MLLQFLIPEQDKLVEIFASVQPDFDQNFILERKIGNQTEIWRLLRKSNYLFLLP